MSKVDLIHNEDFIAYQKDLEKRLTDHIEGFHHLISQPGTSVERELDLAMLLNTKRALILEVEQIIGLPSLYIEKKDAREQHKKRLGERFLGIFRTKLKEKTD